MLNECYLKVSVLDEAAKAHPNTWWWIKADGADLVSGLCESVKGIWSGDVDLADGGLQKSFADHQERIVSIYNLGQNCRANPLEIAEDLSMVEQEIIQDTIFVSSSKFK